MESALDELSRGLARTSATDSKASGGSPALKAPVKSAAEQRVEELQRLKDARKFDGMASSLFDALDSVPVRPKSLLEDNEGVSTSRENFGKGLSVIDQFALRVHSTQERAGDLGDTKYSLSGAAIKSSGGKAGKAGNQKNLSKKARARKDKARQRGVAYSERSAPSAGPSKRGRAKGKSGRLQLL
mmetsp:Transcript_11385/g.22274  ORF Transcript_11385/g.22274 Transcript_11385/m.22274 type:complete len:185 (+) Transcript_11385:173-727(+)